jgi:hypothetical protein
VRSSRLMKSNWTSATCGTEDSRGLSGRREVAPVNPGHRPSASALGYALPARWAGFVRRSNPSGGTGAVADEPQSPWVDPIVAEVRAARERIVAAVGGDLHFLCEQLRARQAAGRKDSRATRSKNTEIGNRPSGIARGAAGPAGKSPRPRSQLSLLS